MQKIALNCGFCGKTCGSTSDPNLKIADIRCSECEEIHGKYEPPKKPKEEPEEKPVKYRDLLVAAGDIEGIKKFDEKIAELDKLFKNKTAEN